MDHRCRRSPVVRERSGRPSSALLRASGAALGAAFCLRLRRAGCALGQPANGRRRSVVRPRCRPVGRPGQRHRQRPDHRAVRRVHRRGRAGGRRGRAGGHHRPPGRAAAPAGAGPRHALYRGPGDRGTRAQPQPPGSAQPSDRHHNSDPQATTPSKIIPNNPVVHLWRHAFRADSTV
jgi:hypothetical protein